MAKTTNRLGLAMVTAAILAIAAAPAGAQTQYWKADFSNGKFSNLVTVEDYSGVEIPAYFYRHLTLDKSWNVAALGGLYAALSASHNGSDQPVSNIFWSPAFTVESEDALLRWKGRSVLPQLAESYRVIYKEDGAQTPGILFTVEAEDPFWSQHAVSLGHLTGKEVQIGFECTSTDKYLLGITDIWAGVPQEPMFAVTDLTKHFKANDDNKTLRFKVVSCGAAPSGVDFIFTAPEGSVICTPSEWGADEVIAGVAFEIEASVPFASDCKSAYSLSCSYNGKTSQLATGTVWTSEYERTLLIDEGTGMWCNSCPKTILELEAIERTYGDQAAIIVTHVNDVLEQTDYWANLRWYDVPRMMANRNRANNGSTLAKILPSFDMPVSGRIDINTIEVNSLQRASVSGRVEFGFGADNSENRYGISYVMTLPFHIGEKMEDIYQENNSSIPNFEQYYILPSKIPTELAFFEHVNASCQYGFANVAGLLPSQITAKQSYDFTFPLVLPDMAQNWDDVNLIVFVTDNQTGEVVNAAQSKVIPTETTSIESVAGNSADTEWKSGVLTALKDNVTVTLYNLQGVCCGKRKLGKGETFGPGKQAGMVLMVIESEDGIKTLKVRI